MKEKDKCPVCKNKSLITTVTKKKIPVMQNYVYNTAIEALSSNSGEFSLEICDNCGFAFNSKFINSLLKYDEGYDNSVPSFIFNSYHLEIINYLKQNYPIEEGFIVDIGCGKGEFLKTLCKQFPGAKGLGMDLSYEMLGNKKEDENPNLRFIQDFFKPEYITQRPSLIVCRHVLEHVEDPVEFLQLFKQSLEQFPNTPLFFEIPDTEWIIENEAFWDFCYEHCNYYTKETFSNLLEISGFEVVKTKAGFGDQYLWIEARMKERGQEMSINRANISNLVENLLSYSRKESNNMLSIKRLLRKFKIEKKINVVWGMATKGVIFTNLIDEERNLIDWCIDINSNKQGKYIPLSGHQITAPESLISFKNESLILIIMNPIYKEEIEKQAHNLSLNAIFYDVSDLKNSM